MFLSYSSFHQLAGTLLPQEVSPGVLATSLSGLLTVKSGGHVLHPQPLPSAKHLWGQPHSELILKALHEVSGLVPSCTHNYRLFQLTFSSPARNIRCFIRQTR